MTFSGGAPRKSAQIRGENTFSRSLWPYVSLLLPTLALVGMDGQLRGTRLASFDAQSWWSYAQSASLLAIVWALLLLGSTGSKGRVRWLMRLFFVVLLTLCLGAQAYFFKQYNAYINLDVSRFATDFSESILHQIFADAQNYLSALFPALLLSFLILLGAIGTLRPPAWSRRLGLILSLPAIVGVFFLPIEYKRRQASTPDALYLHALGGVVMTQMGLTKDSGKRRPRARHSLALHKIVPQPKRRRNIVFVISESVRQDATCNQFDPQCRRTQATNLAFPQRFPLNQMRSLDSCTAISMAVLWSGLAPTEDRETLHSWPLLFDYARESGYFTAYWTSQNIMFGNMRLWLGDLGVDSFFTATDVDPESDIDLGARERLFKDRAIAEIGQLKEPYFLTIQLSNGHYPYLVEKDGPQPFQPATRNKAPENNKKFFNYYQNAIYQQDMHLAKLLGALRKAPGGERAVIVYTSDHGEAFREHHQMGHTLSLYDEEILVPAWIDAPEGTLSSFERKNLLLRRDAPTFHPDLTATILDLMGIWNAPAISTFQERMVGESLLGSKINRRALPMSNCAEVWSCAFENWGYMRGTMKLEAREWDMQYHCWDVAMDPAESVNLGVEACGNLIDLAKQTFSRLPGKEKISNLDH